MVLAIGWWIVIFVVALALLVRSSDWFVEYAEKVGLSIGMSPIIIGVLLLAFGTSLPELGTSIIAMLKQSPEIVLGNVVGSNIANILMVGGALFLVAGKGKFQPRQFKVELWLVPGTAILLFLLSLNHFISTWESVLLLVAYVAYVAYSVRQSMKVEEMVGEVEPEATPEPAKWYYWLFLLLSGGGIYFGAEYTIEAILKIADYFTIGKEVIALTAVAMGTSLPELFVSIAAGRKGKLEMALGNILGSNIFNILAIISIPSFLGPMMVPNDMVSFSMPFMIGLSLLMVGVIISKRSSRVLGAVFVLGYVAYTAGLYIADAK
jgi:cation:H+ antiporter